MDRPFLEITFKSLLVTLTLLGNVDAQGPAGACVPAINVRKNTFHSVSRKGFLRIPCPVHYCEVIPNIRWFRLESLKPVLINETDRVTVTQENSNADKKEVISYLTFKNILNHDDGLYKCTAFGSNSSSESHTINVSVSDAILNYTDESSHHRNDSHNSTGIGWTPYVLICSGILGLVTVVMVISFLSLLGCNCLGLRKPYNQRMQVPLSLNISNDGKPSAHGKPEQQKNTLDTSIDALHPDTSSLYPASDEENTLHMSSCEQGQQQIIYATLEHLTPRESSLISHHSSQLSEYASIRIC